MPLSRREVWDSLAEHLSKQAGARREAAGQASTDEERQRHNRASADLDVVAKHIAKQDETHLDLSELHAWDDAQHQVGEYRWTPNEAQAAAIHRYVDDLSPGPDVLLAELNRLK